LAGSRGVVDASQFKRDGFVRESVDNDREHVVVAAIPSTTMEVP